MIECPVCNRQVSDEAPTCPSCGQPIALKSLIHEFVSTYQVITPSPLNFHPVACVVGLLLTFGGLYVLFVLIPAHDSRQILYQQLLAKGLKGVVLRDPREVLEAVGNAMHAFGLGGWMFKPEVIPVIQSFSWFGIALGLFILSVGTIYRDFGVGYCKKCDIQVIVRRRSFGFHACQKCGRFWSVRRARF